MIKKPACLGAVPVFILLTAFVVTPAYGQTDPYDILLTNDDGIESAGIRVLAQKLRGVGRVHVVAPCGERSGSSMSVALRDELIVRPIHRDNAIETCVDTTPAGAVMLAITTLAPEGGFDLVVSSADFDYPARFVAEFVEDLLQRPAMPGVVLSINIPRASEAEIAGVTVAKMGGSYLRFAYEELEAGPDGRRFGPRIGLETSFPDESDTEAYMRDMITITPLLFDWTAYSAMDQLRGWSLSHQVGR